MTGRRGADVAFLGAAITLALAVVAIHVIRLPEPLGVDQGLFACFARWVPRGWLPYRDIFDSKPPLFLYWWGASGLLPGQVTRAAWWWEGIWLGATLVAAYAVGSRMAGRWVGLAAAGLLFFGLWSPAWGAFWSRAQAEEVLALPMLGSAWLAWRALDRPRLALAVGVLVGVCGLFKIPSMAVALSWAVTWVAGVPLRRAAERVALMVAGIVAAWGLAFAWFAAHGATGSFIEGVFVYHRYNAAFIAPPWGHVLSEFVTKMGSESLVLLVLAAVGIVSLARRGAREVHWLASWIVATMAAVILQRQLAGYQFMLVVPALAMASAYGLVEMARGLRAADSRMLAGAGLVAVLLLAAREAKVWVRAYAPDLDVERGLVSREVYLHAIQQGSYSMADEERAASWVDEHTAPTDGLLVWGLSPGMYALADRHPVTRFPFHKILMTDAPLSRMWPGLDRRRSDLVDRLRADPPAYVLVGRGDSNGFEPLDSFSSMMRFHDFRRMLETEYTPDTTLGHFLVFRRGAPPAP
ncbi:MAG TPA: hypothetical protein VIF09_26920 [Polyangiaceae bacterium]|jgi:hypothetical protein